MFKKIWEQIPGHVRAFTWYMAFFVVVFTSLVTHRSWTAILGMLLFVIGAYFGDQATHLNRHHNEKGIPPPPTWIERQQQKQLRLFQALSIFIICLGIFIAFKL